MPDAWGICRGLFHLARSPAVLAHGGLARGVRVVTVVAQRLAAALRKAGLSQTGQGFRKSKPLQAQLATTKIPETKPLPEPLAKRVENASLATFFGHLEGGVHDPRLVGPVYIEDWPRSK